MRSPQLVPVLEMEDSHEADNGTEGCKDEPGNDQPQLHRQRVLVVCVENAVLREDNQEEVDEVEVEQQGHHQHGAHLGGAEEATKGLPVLADAAVAEGLTAHRTGGLLLAAHQLTEAVQVVEALTVLAHFLPFPRLVLAPDAQRAIRRIRGTGGGGQSDILVVARKRHSVDNG